MQLTRDGRPKVVGRATRIVLAIAALLAAASACQPTTLVGWGAGGSGQLGPDGVGTQLAPLVIDAPWRAVSAGSYLAAGVRSDGTLWQWGYQFLDTCSPTCGTDNLLHSTMATPTLLSAPGDTFTSVSQGTDHVLALTGDGRLLCWGSNSVGQCGTNNSLDNFIPGSEVWRWPGSTPETTWKAASAGHRFSVALALDGGLWTWGQNDHGQLGLGGAAGAHVGLPQRVGTGTWTAVSAGTTHTLGIASDGTLWGWGDNSTGELGEAPGTLAMSDQPVLVDGGTTWTAVAAGDGFSLALRSDGTLWAWGRNEAGELGDGTTTEHDAPEQIGTGTDWTSVSAGAWHALARRSDGTAWAWGDDAFGELGDGATVHDFLFSVSNCQSAPGATYAVTAPVQIGAATDWSMVSAGRCYSLGTLGGGADLDAWGINAFHAYGDGGSASSGSPTQIGPVHDWTAVAEGADHSVGLRADGTLWTWGANDHGQLGDGTTTDRSTPARIGADTWRAAGAGDGYSVAVRSDGTLWAWGRNDDDQLGDGGATQHDAPEQIGTGTTWSTVSVGPDHVLARRADGTLWAWGDNAFGQIGDGSTANAASPVQVGAETWRSASAGFGDSLAVRTDGTLWGWGLNGAGELGDGTTTTDGTPHQIGSATTWSSVSAGRLHSVAIRTDGTLWAWGRNAFGQLGDGTTTDRHDPVQIGSGTTWKSVSAGYDFSVALRTDGTLWAWGHNASGQLGDGTTADQHSPAQLGTASTWTAVASGSTRLTNLALHS